MPRWSLGRQIRILRRRRGWRQEDLEAASGVSVSIVSRIERDLLDGICLLDVRACVEGLGGYLFVDVRLDGQSVSELADARHAALQERIARLLANAGWLVRVEHSFSKYGERGRYDILAYHPILRLLLVVEIKSAIHDAQDAIGRIDVKVRLAKAASVDVGWSPVAVVPWLVVADDRTSRRRIADHPTLFARFSVRGRQATAWLARPRLPAPNGLLLFVSLPNPHTMRVNRP